MPTFSPQLLEPMSDVPVTMWWLAAMLCSLSASRFSPALAGLAGSAALLTRPNLLPVAAVLAAWIALRRPRVERMIMFVAGLVPGCVAVAAFNGVLYGSPLASGYGPVDALFRWGYLSANLIRYSSWLVELHSPAILLALLAPWFLAADAARRRLSVFLLIVSATIALCYLFYVPFDHWPFVRFLLPAIPLLLILSSGVAIRLAASLPAGMRRAAVLVFCGLLAAWCVEKASRLNVFATAPSD